MSARKQISKLLVLVMGLGTFVVVLDNTIMNVSISALVEDLDTTVSGVQTAISLNALMMAAFVLMGGKMADIIGMKKTFVTGAVIYVTGSLLASFSNSLSIFILGWCAIQGFGAAMMLPNVNTIIKTYISGTAQAQAFAKMAGINAIAMATGPLIGGFLTTFLSWRWAFRLEVIVLLFVLAMSKAIPKDALAKVRPSLDKIGVMWQAFAMVFAILGLLLISDYGLFIAKQPVVLFGYELNLFGLSIVPFLFGLALISIIQFVHWERKMESKGKDVLVDLKLFNISNFVKSLNIRFIQVSMVAATTFVVPLYLQVTFGLNAFQTGFILLGFSAGLLITSIGASKRALNIQPKKKVQWGFLVSILGAIIMIASVYLSDNPRGLVPGVFVFGLGLGLITSQIVDLVMSTVSSKETAEASGITSTLETLGSSVGTALVGTILVVALTSGSAKMVEESTVLPAEIKADVTSQMSASVEVVSDEIVADQIEENDQYLPEYEEEMVRIYDEARKNAFAITLLFMGSVSLIAYFLSSDLPKMKVAK